MALSPADRIRLGLDDSGSGTDAAQHQHPHEPPGTPYPEFGGPTTRGALMPERVPNLRLILKEGTAATAPRIRNLVQEMLACNVDNANYWLQQVAAANPKQALELYIELAQFSLPKLKALAVQVDDRSDNPRALTMAQLQQALVAEQ